MREITQRELRNESAAILRGLDAGESFLVTRNGVGVGELVPLRRAHFVRTDLVMDRLLDGSDTDSSRFAPTSTLFSTRVRRRVASRAPRGLQAEVVEIVTV